MGTKTCAQIDALMYLASLVAQFVTDQMPLADLLGESVPNTSHYKPPQEEVIKLQRALADAGFESAAQALASHPDLKG